jgi:uncharacterized protein
MHASDYITRLDLIPHPEGGFYRETYRAAFQVTPDGAAVGGSTSPTSVVTSIHYLLQETDYSGFHRIAYPELWYFHDGEPLTVHEIDAAGNYRTRTLGNGEGQHLSFAIEPGTWFAAELPGKTGFALVSCVVAPAFDFSLFEMARLENMLAQYPQHEAVLRRLCRD